MCEILVNDIFDELKEENQRLANDLSFERDLNKILENIKNVSLILKNNCICSENIEVFKKLNDFEIDYKILKSKQKVNKTEVNKSFHEFTENGFDSDSNPKTSGIQISNIKSMIKEPEPPVRTSSRTSRASSSATKLQCKECDHQFDAQLDLVLHYNSNHNQIDSFVCHECKKVFDSKDVFSAHLLEHQKNEVNSNLVSKSKSKPTTITDYLRSYRKPNTSDNSPEDIPRERIVKTERHMRLITEMLKPSHSSHKIDDKSGVLSTNDIKVESNDETTLEIQCTECQMSLNSMEALESHIKSSHPSLICSKCQQWFKSKDEVFTHLSVIHKIKGHTFCCVTCNYKTPSSSSYYRHKKARVCLKGQFKCPYNGCKCSFMQVFGLKRHKKICQKRPSNIATNESNSMKVGSSLQSQTNEPQLPFDKKNGLLVCRICSYKTKQRYQMVSHQITHSKNRPFICDINGCNNSYKRKVHLNDHQKRVHKQVSQFSLLKKMNENIRNVSKLDFSEETNVNDTEEQLNEEQMVTDFDEKGIKIELISDSDNESNILKNSPKKLDIESISEENPQISNENYSCKLCDYKTFTQFYLTLHTLQDHPEAKPFKCDFPKCVKAYTRADSLAKHKKQAHNKTTKVDSQNKVKASGGGKQFSCDVCDFKTVLNHELRRHMTSHSLDRPFKCDINDCEYRARRKDVLRRHQKKIHKIRSNFTCNYPKCNRGFDSQPLLRQHMNSHKNRFLCRWEGCQYRTDTFAKLNEHRRNENHMPNQLL